MPISQPKPLMWAAYTGGNGMYQRRNGGPHQRIVDVQAVVLAGEERRQAASWRRRGRSALFARCHQHDALVAGGVERPFTAT